MNPIYKYTLSVNGGAETPIFPIYGDDLAKDTELQSGEMFYRARLSGKLRLMRADYELVNEAAFDAEFGLLVYISYNAGMTWAQYWKGKFFKTDCEFFAGDGYLEFSPEIDDEYAAVLAGLDKEFNLIDLAPEIVPVKLDKRPLIQVYVPGQSVIGCFLSGMWWEQECEPEDDVNKLAEIGDGKLNFALNKTIREFDVVTQGYPVIPDTFVGATDATEFRNGDFKIQIVSGQGIDQYQIVRISDNTPLWGVNNPTIPGQITFTPFAGATSNVVMDVHDVSVYARYLCDVEQFHGDNTSTIGVDDIVPDNRNYTRVIGYIDPNTIFFTTNLSDTPTPWGLYQPGKYYQQPAGGYWVGDYYPIARNSWGRVSLWFAFSLMNWEREQYGRKEYTLRDAFPLASVISVLLAQIAPNLTHEETTAYSKFLYGTNPLNGISQRLFITPKSNVVSAGYDQPAQRAMVTLGQVFDMLKKCFRCYWFIEDGKLKIEHVEYFREGGTYDGGEPEISVNLTTAIVTRNGKTWAYGQDRYRFDKPDMAACYQFGWMDEVTQLFEGNPIDILSKYVNPDKIEEITVAQFTSDVDYILLNPSEISKDGFVLLSAVLVDGAYKLPYLNFPLNNVDHYLQNAYVSFIFLQDYYAYDMPAWDYRVNGYDLEAEGVKKLKRQEISFPAYQDPNPINLIRTDLGDGEIQKISINLCSRNAKTTLLYDTE